jgi:hypothetical protein
LIAAAAAPDRCGRFGPATDGKFAQQSSLSEVAYLLIFDDYRFDALAREALERALIVAWLIRFDAREHHLLTAFGTRWPFDRHGTWLANT